MVHVQGVTFVRILMWTFMILADMSDLELKAYAQQLSYMTYDFNMDHDTDIKPIAKK